ncbi:DUF4429 domain-containing protein [Schumannella sp. 10F1B-5-1]|uniref:DUF4429 domain-containing protein n=1 Tax=Schumannella sp. 10F1B-5-1 TaxID=2590780 RepID=UPI0015E83964|nr:DUF4429 domain-containing protein [Schumannella sp. 10F1B-5-1]
MRIEGTDGVAEFRDNDVRFEFSAKAAKKKRASDITFPLNRIQSVEYRPGRGSEGQLVIFARGYSGHVGAASSATIVVGPHQAGQVFAASVSAAVGATKSVAEVNAERAAESAELARTYDQTVRRERQEVREDPATATFRGFSVRSGRLWKGTTASWPLGGADVHLDGTTSSRMSFGRMVGGAAVGTVIAPGLGTAAGAVIGASARRDTSRRFLSIHTSSGTITIEYTPAEESAARRFADSVERSAAVSE